MVTSYASEHLFIQFGLLAQDNFLSLVICRSHAPIMCFLNFILTSWQLVSSFSSREELIEALAQSCFLPLYSGFRPSYRGKRWAFDGSFTDNRPVLQVLLLYYIYIFSNIEFTILFGIIQVELKCKHAFKVEDVLGFTTL